MTGGRLWQPKVVSSIVSDFNVCFDFPLIRVAVEHWQREGLKGALLASINTNLVAEGTTDVKESDFIQLPLAPVSVVDCSASKVLITD